MLRAAGTPGWWPTTRWRRRRRHCARRADGGGGGGGQRGDARCWRRETPENKIKHELAFLGFKPQYDADPRFLFSEGSGGAGWPNNPKTRPPPYITTCAPAPAPPPRNVPFSRWRRCPPLRDPRAPRRSAATGGGARRLDRAAARPPTPRRPAATGSDRRGAWTSTPAGPPPTRYAAWGAHGTSALRGPFAVGPAASAATCGSQVGASQWARTGRMGVQPRGGQGHLETLRWLRANGCPWDKSVCSLRGARRPPRGAPVGPRQHARGTSGRAPTRRRMVTSGCSVGRAGTRGRWGVRQRGARRPPRGAPVGPRRGCPWGAEAARRRLGTATSRCCSGPAPGAARGTIGRATTRRTAATSRCSVGPRPGLPVGRGDGSRRLRTATSRCSSGCATNGCPWDKWVRDAAWGGHLEVLRGARQRLPVERGGATARGEGLLRMLQWLRANGCPGRVRAPKGVGRPPRILQWLRARGCPWDEGTCGDAASNGHLEMLIWARANGCRGTSGRQLCGAQRPPRGARWARARGCPWDADTCSEAAENSHLEVLQARASGCPWTLRRHRSPFGTRAAGARLAGGRRRPAGGKTVAAAAAASAATLALLAARAALARAHRRK